MYYKRIMAFRQYKLHSNWSFNDIASVTSFSDITRGRMGGVLVQTRDGDVPIVRTTTIYDEPAQEFALIHRAIIAEIKRRSGLNIELNNALIEVYTRQYRTMGYHSDQALDIDDDSYICIFSLYDGGDLRTLRVKISLWRIIVLLSSLCQRMVSTYIRSSYNSVLMILNGWE